MKEAHPDPGGRHDDGSAARVNEARDVALGSLASSGSDLVAINAVMAMVRAQQQETLAAKESEKTMRRVVRTHVGQLSLRKRQSLIWGALASGSAIITGAIGSVLQFAGTPSGPFGIILLAFAGYCVCGGVVMGGRALAASTRERMLTLELEDAGDTLSDRGDLAATLDELGLPAFFTRAQLYEVLQQWRVPEDAPEPRRDGGILPPLALFEPRYEPVSLAETARKIGHVDFARLLMAKGLEPGLLEVADRPTSGYTMDHGYRRISSAP
jgi:hypothetical protein